MLKSLKQWIASMAPAFTLLKDLLRLYFSPSIHTISIREIKRHLSTNPELKKYSHSVGSKILGLVFNGRTPIGYLSGYFTILLLFIGAEIAIVQYFPQYIPRWANAPDSTRSILKDIGLYLIATQATIIGVIVPVTITLVSIIMQNTSSNKASSEMRIFFNQSYVRGLATSSICLVIVLVSQILWPFQFFIHELGHGHTGIFFRTLLTIFHLGWFFINVYATWYLIQLALDFLSPAGRDFLRKIYSANIAIPRDIGSGIFAAHYFSLPRVLERPDKAFGVTVQLSLSKHEEVSVSVKRPSQLHDINVFLLKVAFTLWWWRCQRSSSLLPISNTIKPVLSIPLFPRYSYLGQVILLSRSGGISLSRFEKYLVRKSIIFSEEVS
jgi:hypothetical protein